MRITKIRTRNNTRFESIDALKTIATYISSKLTAAGFITSVVPINPSALNISAGGACFRVNTSKLGYNARFNPYSAEIAGWKRTSTPTWSQRVQFNNIINRCLDRFGISANIQSGAYTVRKGREAFDSIYWEGQKPAWEHDNESKGYYIEPLTKEMVKKAKEKHLEHRRRTK